MSDARSKAFKEDIVFLFYFLIWWAALGAIATIGMIGKPRSPITPGSAVATVLIQVAFIVLIVFTYPR